jgi:hypothetical protein
MAQVTEYLLSQSVQVFITQIWKNIFKTWEYWSSASQEQQSTQEF